LASAASFAVYLANQPAPVKPVHLPAVLAVGQGAKFATIASALDAAQPGDTVEVSGEYAEQVRLKSGVTLHSRVPYESVLRAPALSRGPAVIAGNVTAARFSGFRIVADRQQPLATGIELANSEVEVSEVEVQGAGVGIEIRGSASVRLVASTIEDCLAEGVLISGTSAPWISHNLIRRNKGAAVAAREGAQPVLDGNVFEKGTLDLPPDILNTARERNLLLDIRPIRAAPPAVPQKKL
jgi:nitrous oxidase accessory protein NosD